MPKPASRLDFGLVSKSRDSVSERYLASETQMSSARGLCGEGGLILKSSLFLSRLAPSPGYSVFECHLEAADLDRLRKRLEKLVDPAEDNVRLYRFCQDCGTKHEIYGQGTPTEEPEVYIL